MLNICCPHSDITAKSIQFASSDHIPNWEEHTHRKLQVGQAAQATMLLQNRSSVGSADGIPGQPHPCMWTIRRIQNESVRRWFPPSTAPGPPVTSTPTPFYELICNTVKCRHPHPHPHPHPQNVLASHPHTARTSTTLHVNTMLSQLWQRPGSMPEPYEIRNRAPKMPKPYFLDY